MKKMFFTAVFASIAAAALFAQEDTGITFSGWARGAFSPYGIVFTETQTGDKKDYPNIGVGEPERDLADVELYVAGNNGWAGFNLKLYNAEKKDFDAAKNVYYSSLLEAGADVWIKPLLNDWLKIQIGKFSDSTLQGKIGSLNGGFQQFVYKLGGDANTIFKNFDTKNGVVISTAPPLVPGLFVAAKLQSENMWVESTTPGWTDVAWGNEAELVLKDIQIAAGYKIEGIGHIRLQYIGNREEFGIAQVQWFGQTAGDYLKDGLDIPSTGIEAAFAFTMIDGLLIDLGAKFYLPQVYDDTVRTGVDGEPLIVKLTKSPVVALGASWAWEQLSITGRIDTAFGNIIETRDFNGNSGFSLNAHLVPAWDFGFITAGLDAGISIKTTAKVDKTPVSLGNFAEEEPLAGWGIGAFANRKAGNCSIKAGVAFNGGKKQGEAIKQIPAFSIPVIIETNF